MLVLDEEFIKYAWFDQSERNIELIRCLAAGLTYRECAQTCGVSINQISNIRARYLSNLERYRKCPDIFKNGKRFWARSQNYDE